MNLLAIETATDTVGAGTASAAVLSIATILACACGDRSNFICSSPTGGSMSSVYRTVPFTTLRPAALGVARGEFFE